MNSLRYIIESLDSYTHFTNVFPAEDIIKSDTMLLSENDLFFLKYDPQYKSCAGYLSLSRTESERTGFGAEKRQGSDTFVKFILDGRMLASRFKIIPFDFYGWLKKNKNRLPAEIRSEIEIDGLDRYTKSPENIANGTTGAFPADKEYNGDDNFNFQYEDRLISRTAEIKNFHKYVTKTVVYLNKDTAGEAKFFGSPAASDYNVEIIS